MDRDATLMMTTPLADTLGPNMVVGMRRTDAWQIVRALRATESVHSHRLAEAITRELNDHHTLRVV